MKMIVGNKITQVFETCVQKLQKQASLSRRSTTLGQKRSFQPKFWPQFFFYFLIGFSFTRCPNLEKMAKTLISDPILGQRNFPLLVVRQCSNLSTYAISSKPNEPNFKK